MRWGAGVGVGVGGCPDRGIRARPHAFRSSASIPMQPNADGPAHPLTARTAFALYDPERERQRETTRQCRNAAHRTAPHRNTNNAPVAGLAGRPGPKQHTSKVLKHWQGRTGSQNSASTPESRRPTSSFGRQAPRIVLASGRLPATTTSPDTASLVSLCLTSKSTIVGQASD